ncbi:MAG: hypothetical protein CMM87_04565 [Rickettsiales bacterium]|nr:hypothetical protein [Rickettsiales bacterium]|tara:strand:- start:999 stop:2060 length:1062 start_codon:yes stop_codon:yes gene_type:complete
MIRNKLIIITILFSQVIAISDIRANLVVDILTATSTVPNQILNAAKKLIRKKGFIARTDPDIKPKKPTPFSIYMNDDEARFRHFLNSALNDSHVVWAARGGYGSQAVLRKFSRHDAHLEKRPPRKILVGYSDVTALGLFMAHHHDWYFIHGPMLMPSEELHPIRHRLTGSKVNYKASLKPIIKILKKQSEDKLTYTLKPINKVAKKDNVMISGPVVGGNISVLARNINGVLKDISFDNAILFIEDVNEPAIVLREKLEGLFDTGRFNKIKAIIFGDVSLKGGSKREDLKTFYKLINTYVQQYIGKNIPIYEQKRFGHGDYNDALPMYQPSKIIREKGHSLLEIDLRNLNRLKA